MSLFSRRKWFPSLIQERGKNCTLLNGGGAAGTGLNSWEYDKSGRGLGLSL